MTEQHKEQAIEVVRSICRVLHEKRYEDLPSCVDEMEWDNTGEIRGRCTGMPTSLDKPGKKRIF